jgi:hypothetical protein
LQKSKNAKLWVVQKLLEVSFPPFYFSCIQVPIDPMALLQNAKHLSFRDSTTSLVALLCLSLCSNASIHAQMHISKLWRLRMRKAKALEWAKLPGTKNCVNKHKLGTKLIWPWVLVQNQVWHPVQPLCIILRQISSFIPYSSQTRGSRALFQKL